MQRTGRARGRRRHQRRHAHQDAQLVWRHLSHDCRGDSEDEARQGVSDRRREDVVPRLAMAIRFIVPFAAAALLACAAMAGAQDTFPEGPGMDILMTKCRTCHMPDRVTKVGGRAAENWKTLVTTMVNRGAPLTEDDIPVLVD